MPSAWPRLTLTVAVGLAWTLAACSGEGDEDKAIGAAEGFFAALADVDPMAACELNIGADGRPLDEEHPDWEQCQAGFAMWADQAVMPAGGEIPVASFDTVEVTGDTAHISEHPPDEFQFIYTFDLKKVGDDWYIDGSWYLG